MTTEWRVATSSIIKILVAALLVFIAYKLWPLFLLVTMAILLAVTMAPAVTFLQRRGVPRSAALALMAIFLFASTAAFFVIVLPPLVDQIALLAKEFPEYQKLLLGKLPEGAVRKAIVKALNEPGIPVEKILLFGQGLAGVLSELVLMLVLAVYFTADGKRTYQWLVAFFSAEHRDKIDETATEAARITYAYVFGQVVTSVLCSVYAFLILTILGVPAPIVLAVMAGVFDILPMLGFFLFIIPAVGFALTVSVGTGLAVLGLYVAYHMLEVYVLVPKIYGNRLRLSDLVVLLSVLAGGMLAGIPGAILILPFVAIYPAVERIWLAESLGRSVVARHKVAEKASKK